MEQALSIIRNSNTVLLLVEGRWLVFAQPEEVVQARRVEELRPALRRIEAAVGSGCYAAGFLCYEAAPAFDPALITQPPGPLPLLWFGLYRTPLTLAQDELPSGDDFKVGPWAPSISKVAYREAFDRVKHYIAAGDTYQVNLTQRLRAQFEGDSWAFFLQLVRAQPASYAAYINLGQQVLCSASPELFFTRVGDQLTCRPMKGTAPRALTAADDLLQAQWLQNSPKNRAENVMIVDMVRNDLGRLAAPGSVVVPRLFEVERYPTLWQLTSTVQATSSASLTELLTALFPCASITGAPKVRTCELIAELEDSPRGLYTGSIGYMAPNGDALFNVAIRSVHLDYATGVMEYGTGGGITWDSTLDDEYEEGLLKARLLTEQLPPFDLLETLLWRPGRGYFLLEGHLERLGQSADYFDFPFDSAAVKAQLQAYALGLPSRRHRVRLLLESTGRLQLESVALAPSSHRPWQVGLARRPVEVGDRFLYHKTTRRSTYEAARADWPDLDDVLLWNDRGEVTESTIANVVVRQGGRLLTPPVACGLLPGVYRGHLLASGRLEEAAISLEALATAQAVYLINSVRGWLPVELPLVGSAGP